MDGKGKEPGGRYAKYVRGVAWCFLQAYLAGNFSECFFHGPSQTVVVVPVFILFRITAAFVGFRGAKAKLRPMFYYNKYL